jgi:hypothetical protein
MTARWTLEASFILSSKATPHVFFGLRNAYSHIFQDEDVDRKRELESTIKTHCPPRLAIVKGGEMCDELEEAVRTSWAGGGSERELGRSDDSFRSSPTRTPT